METRPYLSSFGRNRGRSLRPRQQGLVDTLLPRIMADPASLPKSYQRVALEIGFGSGEHLAALAKAHPETLCIGCEPFINGVAKLLCAIDEEGLDNIRLFTDDARKLIDAMPENIIDDAYILFPDPWPKAKHNKRRLVNHDTLARLARIHKPGGKLLLATDHVDYASWMLEHILVDPNYHWTARGAGDWSRWPEEWVETKYQRKTSAEGRAPNFFHCVRKEKGPR